REIGQTKFDVLKAHYAAEVEVDNGEDVSARFQDVFQTVQTTTNKRLTVEPYEESETIVPIDTVDFTPLIHSLEKQMIDPKKVLTPINKRYIVQLLTLYDLASFEIEKALQWALTDENTLDMEQLKQACHDLFQKKHHVAYPEIKPKMPEKVTNMDDVQVEQKTENLSKEEQLIQTLETISPKQLLEDLSSGEAHADDMVMIRDVMTSQGLPAPVMNVIIHYVMLQTNMQLSKPYVSKIASHWSRVGLKTAKEAMDFAKSEIKKRTEKRETQATKRNYRQSGKKEIIPD